MNNEIRFSANLFISKNADNSKTLMITCPDSKINLAMIDLSNDQFANLVSCSTVKNVQTSVAKPDQIKFLGREMHVLKSDLSFVNKSIFELEMSFNEYLLKCIKFFLEVNGLKVIQDNHKDFQIKEVDFDFNKIELADIIFTEDKQNGLVRYYIPYYL